MSNFKNGDRVVFNEQYNHAKRGDKGTIERERRPGGTECVVVRLDKGGVVECFEWRLLPDASAKPHAFKVGDKGLTVGGNPYEVLAVAPKRKLSVIAEVAGEIETYTANGSFYANGGSSNMNLLPPKQTITFFTNVYANPQGNCSYATEAEARSNAMKSALVVAHPVTIELP